MSSAASTIVDVTGDVPRVLRNGAVPFEKLVAIADSLAGVRRGELAPGERLVVATRNSIYSLRVLADGRFAVSGGWLARESLVSIESPRGHVPELPATWTHWREGDAGEVRFALYRRRA